MQLIPLENEAQLNEIASAEQYSVILKHNTTCPISKGVVTKLNDDEAIDGVKGIYILDLLANRELSNAIADRFGVLHQSPQVLLIKDDQCVYNEWGFDISSDAIRKAMEDSH